MSQIIRREDVKSDEEFMFYLWLVEAEEHGFVDGFAYEPTTYNISPEIIVDRVIQQKTQRKTEQAQLFTNHGKDGHDQFYTPDYIFNLTPKGKIYFGDNVFWQTCQHQKGEFSTVYTDVKSSYNPYTGGSNAVFFLKARMIWGAHGKFVHKINPKVFFKRTWAPDTLRWMKNRKLPTKTKLGNKTMNVLEYTKKHEWKMAINSTLGI